MKHLSTLWTLSVIGLCITLTGVAGCDDDSDSNYDAGAIPEHFDPGVDADAKLDGLSEAEATTLCENSVAWGQGQLTRNDEAVQATCIGLAGIPAALSPDATDAVADCEAAVTTCKAGPFPKAEVCGERVPALMACGQTVQDYQDCIEAQAAAYFDTFKDLTCDDLQTADLTLGTPSSCASLWDACPELDERPATGDGDGDADADAGM